MADSIHTWTIVGTRTCPQTSGKCYGYAYMYVHVHVHVSVGVGQAVIRQLLAYIPCSVIGASLLNAQAVYIHV